jgi:hypothetical protein
MRLNLHEVLMEVSKVEHKADKVKVLQKYQNNVPLKELLKLAYDKAAEFDLPEGDPPYKADKTVPVGMSETDLYNELRRVKRCLKGDPLPKIRKESIFIEICEGIHWTEAELLIAIKDGKLADKYRGMSRILVKEAFPGLLPEEPKKSEKQKEE